MAHQDRRSRTLVVGVELFKRHRRRLELRDDFRNPMENLRHALRQGKPCATANNAGLDEPRTALRYLQYTVSCDVEPRIHPQYSRGSQCAGRLVIHGIQRASVHWVRSARSSKVIPSTARSLRI